MKEMRKNGMLGFIKDQKGVVFIVLIAVFGILLMLFPTATNSGASGNDLDKRMTEYERRIEKEIAQLCEGVRGVNNVSVNVYFDSGFESVYAVDEESRQTSTGQNTEKKYVTLGSGSNQNLVCLYEKMPSICGVAIVCRGGGDPVISGELTRLISSAFGVPVNKIYVTEAKK